ncbi:MAG: hypothetical protein O2894_13455, partial [Planctomycetota bacterium]|nr:hypothetical protein [Planctomycetota bacterium]
ADVPPAAPEPTGDPTTDAVLAAVAARVSGFVTRADAAREAAADPRLSAARAIRRLEEASDELLLAQRLLREAPEPLRVPLAFVADDVRSLLLSTWVELADLLRLEGWYDDARARVRAALLLDPGNEAAREQRRFIEQDALRPLDSLEQGVSFARWSPSPLWGISPRCGPYPALYGTPHYATTYGHGYRTYRGGVWFGVWGGSHRAPQPRR